MSTHPATISTRPASAELRIPAFVISLRGHAAIFFCGAAASAVVAANGQVQVPVLPRQPLLGLAIAFLLAHCNLIAIWWASTSFGPKARTLVAALCCFGLWLLLIQLLSTAQESGLAAVSWAVCLASQVALTGLAATVLELVTNYQSAAARNRFSLRSMLIWTTVVAVVLGISGAIAGRSGFKLSDVPDWEFFSQIQCFGVASAALAIGVYCSLRLPQTWSARFYFCLATIVAFTIATPLWLVAVFAEDVGAFVTEIVWLVTGQGLFLVATLGPLKLNEKHDHAKPDAVHDD
jgi:hypothetical protein